MKIVVVGGHLSPALAVIDAMPEGTKVLFIGRKHALEGADVQSLEYKTITSRKIPFIDISSGRLQRTFTKHTIPSLLKLPYGFVKAFAILAKFRPDVVLGFGGYVSIPVVLSAFLLRIPVVIHEQTLGVGFANLIASVFAKKNCISWETSRRFFPKRKVVLTGNPMRQFKIQNSKFKIDEGKNRLPTVYITGGSSGSHFINTIVEGCIPKLLEKYNIIHQAGDAQEFHDFNRLEALRNTLPTKLGQRYLLKKFIEPSEIGGILSKTSLVVSRGGMNTITELIYFRKPALLIPLPESLGQEQLNNALFLKTLGTAEIAIQKDINSSKFLQIITEMINNIDDYKKKSLSIGNLVAEDAAYRIVGVAKNVIFEKKKNNIRNT